MFAAAAVVVVTINQLPVDKLNFPSIPVTSTPLAKWKLLPVESLMPNEESASGV